MKSERGVMIIIVAVALLGLTLLSAFVLDYGVLWSARAQTQNAADAGALGAAFHLVLDSSDLSGARDVARKLANANPVWGESPQTPDILVSVPVTCPAATGGGTCVKVDVQRGSTDVNGASHTNALPTFFANLAGIHQQGIMATATAQLAAANSTGCMRPWFMLDKYTDANGNGSYDAGDSYSNPGYKVPADIGTIVHFHQNASPSGYGQLDVGSGGSAIQDAIEHCVSNGASYHIGQVVDTKPGGTVGPERHGVDNVVAWDPFAYFDTTTNTVKNSCAATGCTCDGRGCPNGSSVSPRVVIVALCSPLEADCAAAGPNNGHITITNFLSFFLLGYSGGGSNFIIDAELIGAAGAIDPSGGASPSAFLQVVRLVR